MTTLPRCRRLAVATMVVVGAAPLASAVEASAPPADDRDVLVDALVESAEIADVDGFSLDRECVAGLVDQLPDSDVQIILAEYRAWQASEASDAIVDAVGQTEPPEVSAAADEIATKIFTCLAPTADPALVDAVMGLLEAHPEDAEGLDLECVRSVLGVFPDPLLQTIVDVDGEEISDETLSSNPEVADDYMEYGFLIFACTLPDAFETSVTADVDVSIDLTVVTEAP